MVQKDVVVYGMISGNPQRHMTADPGFIYDLWEGEAQFAMKPE